MQPYTKVDATGIEPAQASRSPGGSFQGTLAKRARAVRGLGRSELEPSTKLRTQKPGSALANTVPKCVGTSPQTSYLGVIDGNRTRTELDHNQPPYHLATTTIVFALPAGFEPATLALGKPYTIHCATGAYAGSPWGGI